MDTARIGEVAMKLMEDVSEDNDYEVGSVMVIVELTNSESTGVFTRCSDTRFWVQLGLVETVALNIRHDMTSED